MAPEFGGPVIVSREPGVVKELRPFRTSRVPWAPHEGGGMVSGRGGELGPDFVDSKELLGPDAGMFAYNGSEFASTFCSDVSSKAL